jgi:hypothetical protein
VGWPTACACACYVMSCRRMAAGAERRATVTAASALWNVNEWNVWNDGHQGTVRHAASPPKRSQARVILRSPSQFSLPLPLVLCPPSRSLSCALTHRPPSCVPSPTLLSLLTYLLTYVLTYLLTYLLTSRARSLAQPDRHRTPADMDPRAWIGKDAPPATPPLPAAPPGYLFHVEHGAAFCEVTNGGTCITDGAGPYGECSAAPC